MSEKEYTQWYLQKGEGVEGDEATVDYYSDDEYDEDDRAVKKTRKNVTNLLHGYSNLLHQRVSSFMQARDSDTVVHQGQITNTGIVFKIDNLNNPLSITDQVSQIDRRAQTSFSHRKEEHLDKATGVVTRKFVSMIMSDPTGIVKDYLSSERWAWNFAIATCLCLSGLVLIGISLKSLVIYLPGITGLLLNVVWALLIALTAYDLWRPLADAYTRRMRTVLDLFVLVSSLLYGLGFLAAPDW